MIEYPHTLDGDPAFKVTCDSCGDDFELHGCTFRHFLSCLYEKGWETDCEYLLSGPVYSLHCPRCAA